MDDKKLKEIEACCAEKTPVEIESELLASKHADKIADPAALAAALKAKSESGNPGY